MHVTAYVRLIQRRGWLSLGSFGNLQQIMNINLRPKKCSGQSCYDKHDSYATVLSKANDCNFHFLSTDLTDFAATGCNSSITLFTFSTTSTSEVGITFRPDDKIEGTEVLTIQVHHKLLSTMLEIFLSEIHQPSGLLIQQVTNITKQGIKKINTMRYLWPSLQHYFKTGFLPLFCFIVLY